MIRLSFCAETASSSPAIVVAKRYREGLTGLVSRFVYGGTAPKPTENGSTMPDTRRSMAALKIDSTNEAVPKTVLLLYGHFVRPSRLPRTEACRTVSALWH